MFTKLGKILIQNICPNSASDRKFAFLPIIFSNDLPYYIENKDYGGTTRYISPVFYSGDTSYISGNVSVSGSASAGIAVGSGDTPATENDYCLETKINSLSGTVSNIVSGFDNVNKNYYTILTLSLTNSTQEAITVKEIGRIASFNHSNSKGGTSSSSRDAHLLERTVLENPITIEAGTSALIDYRIDFPAVED